ncbi:ZIP family metal transporter [bacterium]|nr:ZIP family metal transporter [bacterium]
MIFEAAVYGLVIFLASVFGGLAPFAFSKKSEAVLPIAISFGAGLLLGMAFLHMLPEAAELAGHGFGYWFLAGFVILLILERFVMVHACEEHGCHYHTVGIAAFAGLTVHGLMEGFALGSTLYVSGLAPLILVAILSHKIPAGFALSSILHMAKLSHRQIVLFVVGVSLSVPLGLALSLGLLEQKNLPPLSGALLALSAGSFVYIGACDLLPELHRDDRNKLAKLTCFLLGLVLSAVSGLFWH